MPRPDYFPRRDADFRAWTSNFAQRLSSDPQAYGATVAEAQNIADLTQAFEAALSVASRMDTRTAPNVAAKDSARRDLVAALRPVVRRVQAHGGLSDQARIDLGLTVAGTLSGAAHLPDDPPLLILLPPRRGRQDVRIFPGDGGRSRQKPRGVMAAGLFVALGDAAPQSIEDFRFAALVTKSDHTLALDERSRSKTVWIMARWFDTKGNPGPASRAVSATVV